jgi:autotransporter-associated beta strand protein
MKHIIFSTVFTILAGVFALPLAGLGQGQQILLNIGDSTYPTVASPANFTYDAAQRGISSAGINLSDPVSTYAPGFGSTVAAGAHNFSGGQTITLSANAGSYAKNTAPGDEPDGLMDLYLYYNSTSANTVKLGNLNLQTNATYMLYVYGWIPSSGTGEDSEFTPLNDNAHITYASTTGTNGLLAVQFTTSANYVNTDTLDFTWANRSGQGDGVLNGIAIVQTGGFSGPTAWNGGTSTAWNTVANWTNGVPNGNAAVINVNTPNVATINAVIPAPASVVVGAASGTTGQVNQVSATVTNSGSLTVGASGGTGVYNLANTAAGGGTLTGFGQGSGSLLSQAGNLVVGTDTGSAGTFNMNSSGSLTVNANLQIGANLGNGNGTGTFNLDNGTVNASDMFVGYAGGGGALNVSGGAVNLTAAGPSYVGYLTGSGVVTVTGGTVSIGHELRVGGSDVSGTTPNATGAVTLSGGNLYVSSLSLAYGWNFQNSVSGTVTVNSGGTLICTNDTHLAWGGQGSGKLVINGGTFILGPTAAKWLFVGGWDTTASELDITNGNLILDNNSSLKLNALATIYPTVVNQEGGSVTFYSDTNSTIGGTGNLDLNEGGTSSSVATYNLDGGTLTVPEIIATVTSGTTYFYFNGGTIRPTTNSTTFMQGLSAAYVSPGGAHFDTAGNNITVAQSLQDNGGGLTKIGNGTLTLAGGYGYSGPTVVQAGALSLDASQSSSASALTVNNATLNLSLNNGNSSLNAGNVTFAGCNTLNLNFGSESSYLGNPAINAGGYSVSNTGTNVINIAGTELEVGQYPLIYTGGSVPTNNFTLGTLPTGVVATLANSGVSLDLVITAAGQNLTWYGADNSGNPLTTWDINTSVNWNSGNAKYLEYGSYGDRVTFDDTVYSPSDANVTLNTTVVPSSVTFNNSSTPCSLTGSGGISGNGMVTMNGTNSVFLGTSNSFTGGITINAGTLVVTNDNALGANSGLATLSGGTLQFSNSTASVRAFSVVSNSTINVAASDAAQLSGLISGSAALSTTGNGTLTMSNYAAGLLSVNGGTTVVVGTVSPSGAADVRVGDGLGTSGTLDVNSGGMLSNNWLIVGRDSGAGTLNVNGGSIQQVSGGIFVGAGPGAGSVGIFTLNNGVVSSPAYLEISEGTSSVGTVNQTGGTLTTSSGTFIIGNTGTGTYNLSGGTVNATTNSGYTSIGLSSGAIGILDVGGTGVFNASVGGMLVGQSGTGTLTVTNSGLVNVGPHNYLVAGAGGTGAINLDGGTIQAEGVSTFGGTSTFNFNGGTLKPATNNATFMEGLTTVNVRNGGAIFDTVGFDVTVAQALLHSTIGGDNATDGGLVKNGGGIMTLSGANTFNGNVTINAGGLELAQSVPVLATNSTVSIAASAILQLDNVTVTNIVAAFKTNGVAAANGLYNYSNSSGFITGGGYLQVGAAAVGPSGPAQITNSYSAGSLNLSWPAGQGWRLQMQTNSLGGGLGTNWVYVTDGTVSGTNIMADPNSPAVFYRLQYP